MDSQFDPYHKWLGIPAKHQPPNHYRLLGIDLFEDDAEVIEAASMRHIRFLREIHDGPHVRQAQRLLNEITVARLCLLDESKRRQYNAVVQQRLDQRCPADVNPVAAPKQRPATPKPPATSALGVLRDPPVVVTAARSAMDGKRKPAHPTRQSWPRFEWAKVSWWGPAAVSALLGGLLWAVLAVWGGTASTPTRTPDDKALAKISSIETENGTRSVDFRAGNVDAAARKPTQPEPTQPAPARPPAPARMDELPPVVSAPKSKTPAKQQRSMAVEIPVDLFEPGRVEEIHPSDPRRGVSAADAGSDAAAEEELLVEQADSRPSRPRQAAAASPDQTFTGALLREVWHCDGNQVADVITHVELHPEADVREEIQQFASPEDAADQYGQRITGYLHPPITGDYTFKIRANAEGVLLISSDADTDNKERIETNRRVPLVAGKVYYVEAWHKESTGRDYFSVGWILPDGVEENPIPGNRLSTEPRFRAPHETDFVIVKPTESSASLGSAMDVDDESAIVASGPHRRDEIYRVSLQPRWPAVSAIRLQALPRETLPAGGPGRGPGGRFSLAQIKVKASSKSGASPDRVLKLISVGSDFEGAVERIADGNLKTVWSVRNPAAETMLTMVFARPVPMDADTVLLLEIHNRECLGCFRLLATSAIEPAQLPLASGAARKPADPGEEKVDAWFINLGGGDWTDDDGTNWIQSKPFGQQAWGHEGGRSVVAKTGVSPLASSAIRGIQAFRAEVPNGRYELSLFFCENWSQDPRRRIFSVSVEGRPALVNFNLLATAGGAGKPLVHRIANVLIKDGRLDVEFEPANPNALTVLNAISFRPARMPR